MALRTLDHCSIRTLNLEASRVFYVDVLGMREGDRPDFPFPGAWLYLEDRAVIHLVGVDPDDSRGLVEYLGGDIDTGHAGGRRLSGSHCLLCDGCARHDPAPEEKQRALSRASGTEHGPQSNIRGGPERDHHRTQLFRFIACP